MRDHNTFWITSGTRLNHGRKRNNYQDVADWGQLPGKCRVQTSDPALHKEVKIKPFLNKNRINTALLFKIRACIHKVCMHKAESFKSVHQYICTTIKFIFAYMRGGGKVKF